MALRISQAERMIVIRGHPCTAKHLYMKCAENFHWMASVQRYGVFSIAAPWRSEHANCRRLFFLKKPIIGDLRSICYSFHSPHNAVYYIIFLYVLLEFVATILHQRRSQRHEDIVSQ